MSQHPSTGLKETLQKYYLAEQFKLKNKRRKLRELSMEDAIQRFVELSAASALSKSSLTRNHKVYLQSSKKDKSTKDAKKNEETLNEDATEETEEESPADDVRKTPPEKQEGKFLDLAQQDQANLQQQEQQVELDMKRIENAKRQVHKDQVELWGVYRYGLQHVMALNDLSAAPDAILPGNFP